MPRSQQQFDLVIAANNGGNVLNNAVRYAVTHHLGSVISLSWGAPEAAIRGRGNNIQVMQAHQNFQAAQAASISVFAAAGDFGASNLYPIANALYPASDPLVTAVGGTNLFIDDSGNYQSEDVWNDSDPALCPFGCAAGIFGVEVAGGCCAVCRESAGKEKTAPATSRTTRRRKNTSFTIASVRSTRAVRST